jgi:hypothetical protein
MADKPDKTQQVAPVKITVSDAALAPFIFFEGVPNLGFNNGVVNLTLAAGRHLMTDGISATDFVAVAHLRCNVIAAMELRKAIDDALLLASKTEGKPN